MLKEEGFENVVARHHRLAEGTRKAVEGWGLQVGRVLPLGEDAVRGKVPRAGRGRRNAVRSGKVARQPAAVTTLVR
jgi:alanine-glyoxylate transaminase/serine-glyoxylate transaminase/serine-pyruvate transaminase